MRVILTSQVKPNLPLEVTLHFIQPSNQSGTGLSQGAILVGSALVEEVVKSIGIVALAEHSAA